MSRTRETGFAGLPYLHNGVGGGSFAPRRTLTAQEALSMAQRMLENPN